MNPGRLARASSSALALFAAGCYWLASYGDLSRDFADGGATDAGTVAPFCPPDSGPRVYCMAFDGVDAAALGVTVSGATVEIVNGPYVSPPNSLSVGVLGASSFGRYQVPFSFQPTTTTLQFEMQPNTVNEGTTTLAITLSQASTQTDRTLNVVVDPNGGFQVQEFVTLGDGGTRVYPHALHQVDAGTIPTWHHVVLTLNADDATGTYTSGFAVDGQTFEEGQPLTLPWVQGTARLDIGVTFAAAGGSVFYLDNVRADFAL